MKYRILAALYCLLCLQIGWAQHTASGPHIDVALLSEHDTVVLGQQQWLGVQLSPEDHWHTYWRNPGDSGEAPTIRWQSNSDAKFGDIQWPLPEQIPIAHLVNYGYSGSTVFMVPFTVTAPATGQDTVSLTADVSWLVCKEDCIPGWATLQLTLPIATTPQASYSAPLFEQTRTQLPANITLSGHHEITEKHLSLSVSLPQAGEWQVFPLRDDIIQHNAPQQWSLMDNNSAGVVIAKSDYFSAGDDTLEFLLSNGKQGYYVTTTTNTPNLAPHKSPHQTDNALWLILVFAFIGGLILNIMPCVLPVLSLKAISLASGQQRHHWGYLLGILTSFWAFAAAIIALKASGAAIGWGFHLQEPLVIATLAYLFVLIALMLWDATPSAHTLAGIGQQLTEGKGFASQFFTGVLAVIVASPCTAPLMASALGVAMVSPALHTVLIFTALALGFALPMTLLSLSPQFAALIPKPGVWMNHFKHFLAFPMLATVVWLAWIFLGQTNSYGQLWLLSGLVAFALCVWLASTTHGVKQWLALALALAIALFSSYNAAKFQPIDKPSSQQAYSEQQLNQWRNQQEVVLVNMTADWCITCKVNEHVALSNDRVQHALSQPGVRYMVGDWTNKNTNILDFLTRYQRSGVPLYVVYAGTHSEQVLPQVLTPDTVINAITLAQQELHHETP